MTQTAAKTRVRLLAIAWDNTAGVVSVEIRVEWAFSIRRPSDLAIAKTHIRQELREVYRVEELSWGNWMTLVFFLYSGHIGRSRLNSPAKH
jgi:hypothetical protein